MLYTADISNWEVVKKSLEENKKDEMRLRKKICSHFFELDKPNKGTFKEIKYDREIKAVAKVNNSVDATALESIWSDLSLEEQACFKPVWQVVTSNLNKLPEDSIAWDCITTKSATPTLTITEV